MERIHRSACGRTILRSVWRCRSARGGRPSDPRSCAGSPPYLPWATFWPWLPGHFCRGGPTPHRRRHGPDWPSSLRRRCSSCWPCSGPTTWSGWARQGPASIVWSRRSARSASCSCYAALRSRQPPARACSGSGSGCCRADRSPLSDVPGWRSPGAAPVTARAWAIGWRWWAAASWPQRWPPAAGPARVWVAMLCTWSACSTTGKPTSIRATAISSGWSNWPRPA